MSFAHYQWHLFRANLDPVTGSEQRGTRPVLVVSDEDYNQLMPVVTVLPLTSHKPGRQIYPNEVLVPKATAGLPEDSLILAHQIRTISKTRLTAQYGELQSSALRDAVRQALKLHLTLE
jgi:mRNA interferase MazF